MRLARVLDHRYTVLFGERENPIHVRHLSVQMHRYYRGYAAIAAQADQGTRLVPRALLFQIFPQPFDGHIVCLLVDIDELRQGASLGDSFSGGDKCMWYGHDHIAVQNPARDESKTQRVRPAADGNGMIDFTEFCERGFEFLNHRTADETGRKQSLTKNSCELLLQFRMWCNEIKEGNLIRQGH